MNADAPRINPRHHVLDGLPPYGPMPEAFSVDGQGKHREGFVVGFTPLDAPEWVGNFQRGMTPLDAVVDACHDNAATVIAGGQAYVVDVVSRACMRTFGGDIDQVLALKTGTVFSNGLWLEATDGERLLWRTRRLSWDGMTTFHVEGDRIVGHAFDPLGDTWLPFDVDINTGDVTGGAYPREL